MSGRQRKRARRSEVEEEGTDMIGGVSKVVIEVEDRVRARAFWTETMELGLVQDAPYEEERWLEVRCPDQGTNLFLELRTGKRAERREQSFGSWSMFDDAEGNRFALEQTESEAP